MQKLGMTDTMKSLYRPHVQVAYAVEDGHVTILSQEYGKCYAAAREHIYKLRKSTKRVQWKRDSLVTPPDVNPGYGHWAEMVVGNVRVGWIQAGALDAREADWY